MLRKDAKRAVEVLAEAGEAGLTTIRFLVESYYDHQRYRMEASNRVRAAMDAKAPENLMRWLNGRWADTETAIAYMLKQYVEVEKTGMGTWATSHVGIGPIISSGLIAYIDMDKAKHVSSVWRFFGLDPTLKWGKGEKRPWNARAKVLAWKIGQSFLKFHNKPGCEYGRIYAARKALEVQRNEQGQFSETAKATLTDRKIKDAATRKIYEAGQLPAGRIELRAERYAVKLFLSAWWREAYRRKFGAEPEDPWVIAKMPPHSRVIG
jgi:hypothetical protein